MSGPWLPRHTCTCLHSHSGWAGRVEGLPEEQRTDPLTSSRETSLLLPTDIHHDDVDKSWFVHISRTVSAPGHAGPGRGGGTWGHGLDGWMNNESGRGPQPMEADAPSGFSPTSGIDSPWVYCCRIQQSAVRSRIELVVGPVKNLICRSVSGRRSGLDGPPSAYSGCRIKSEPATALD